MSAIPNTQYLRKASLILVNGEKGLDLSQMHFTFQTVQDDEEQPSNCSVRVFNLSDDTVKQIKQEYSRVILQAGYENNAAYGVIFDGTIKQFRIGRMPDAVNTYLDILFADGDISYNFAVCNRTVAAGSTPGDRIAEAVAAMTANGGVSTGYTAIPSAGGILPRGKVLFGLARAIVRAEVQNIGATWSIQNGKVNITPLTGYLPGEAIVLTSRTGMIGRPEQTQDGVRVRCLLNPKMQVGGLVKIDNKSINQTIAVGAAALPGGAQQPFNSRTAIEQYATISADGLYRIYVCEHRGDTRGQEWYTDLICLTVDPVTMKVKAYG